MFKNLLLVAAMAILTVACSDTQNATKVGNPSGGLPVPTSQMKAEKYLADHPTWEGKNQLTGDEYVIKFNVTEKTVTISSSALKEPIKINFEIMLDGSIVTKNTDSLLSISATFDAKIAEYPIKMTINDADGAKIAEAVVSTETNTEPQAITPPAMELPWWGDFIPKTLLDGSSTLKHISRDGRLIAFKFEPAYNAKDDWMLPPSDFSPRLYLKDLKTATTRRLDLEASVNSIMSNDGLVLIFISEVDGHYQIVLMDLKNQQKTVITKSPTGEIGDGDSFPIAIGGDNNNILYRSEATNLVENDTNYNDDYFVYNVASKTSAPVTDTTYGYFRELAAGDISDDGRYVVFCSNSTSIVPDITDGFWNVFLRDMKDKTTQRISTGVGDVGPDGNSIEPTISADGRYIAFLSHATNLVAPSLTNQNSGIFVYDRINKTTELVSEKNYDQYPSISKNGKYVTYSSYINSTIYISIRNIQEKTTELIKAPIASWHGGPLISSDGRYVAFASNSNIIPNIAITSHQIFVKDLLTGKITIASVPDGK